MYLKASAIKLENGKRHIGYDHPDKILFNWATNQRALKRKGLLAPDREKTLDAIVFDWNPVDDSGWEKTFAKLVEFKAREGHCNVPQRHVEGTIPLGKWVNFQRVQRDSMPAERRQRLDAIGVVWNVRDDAWEKGFAALLAFKAREGHCNVPQRHIEQGFRLGTWVNSRRTNKNKLSDERKKRLDEIGFVWSEQRKAAADAPGFC
jgi:hypothetical protein